MTDNKLFPISKLFPNIVTLMGLCFGLTSIKYTFMGKWELAVIFITIAAIIDGIDGRLARLLHSTSEFGAQLDSLADFLNFGVAPAFLLYFWHLKYITVYGWISVTMFVICMAIRLARFNTSVNCQLPQDHASNKFMVGMPAPAGALLAIAPMMLSFNNNILLHIGHHIINHIIIYLILISLLVVSRIPTFSFKSVNIPRNIISLVMFFFGLLIVLLITKPWITLPIIGVVYLSSIPITAITYLYLKRKSLD